MNALTPTKSRQLTPREFTALKDVPPELEWWANFTNAKTKRAYEVDIKDFMAFTGITTPERMREVVKIHVIAWRDHLQDRGLKPSTIRRKLAALASLYSYLCDKHTVTYNPVDDVDRPRSNAQEGSTPIISNDDARTIFDRVSADTLKGKRDRAILAVLLYHAIRREELCRLNVEDRQSRGGVPHLKIHGKGSKIRYIVFHPLAQPLIDEYLEEAGHSNGPLFRPVQNNSQRGNLNKPLSPDAIYSQIVHPLLGVGPHALRATTATNALENDSPIRRVQEMLGHASLSTTQLYDRRESKPEESPVFRVKY